MTRDEVVHHIVGCDPTAEDIQNMYTAILRHFLKEFELLGKERTIQKFNLDVFLQKNKKADLLAQQTSLGYNLYQYLSSVKANIEAELKPTVLHLESGKDAIAYGKLLSKKPIVEILKRADGSRNATQLARELKIARSNMSVYLSELKTYKLISIDGAGKISRRISAITTNFEVGLR
jgi:hypothetical protein